MVRLYACLAAGVNPEGSHVSCALNQKKATKGVAASKKVGLKRESTRHSDRMALAKVENR
jgi:hypothetical protein